MRTRAAAALLLLALAGCGTILDTWNDARIYGGVRVDVETAFTGKSFGNHIDATPALRVLSVLDLPFSLVLDTLFLPYTVLRTLFPARPSNPAPGP